MAEVAALPWNGSTVVSTFSGAGGSCFGFRLAGYRVLWASEFVDAAAETYRANYPETPLDTRDIRTVDPTSILAAIGRERGEIDVLEGSPPCAAFSTAGTRAASWGAVKPYSDTKQRTDDLFFEYARLLDGLRPRVFVAENVSGLVKGVAKGYFKRILRELEGAGYRVEARLLDAQWLGVPQARQRIIFVGVRNDLGLIPAFPKPLPYRYSVRDALPWIAEISGRSGPGEARTASEIDAPMNAIIVQDPAQTRYEIVSRSPRRVESGLRAYPDTRGAFGNASDCTDTPAPTVLADSVGTHWIEGEPPNGWNAEDRRARRVDPDDASPTILHHGRGGIDRGLHASNDAWRPLNDGPATTIQTHNRPFTQSELTLATGPTERRKFTIAELRRICGFPDDFILTGTYAQQWERLGRAVPPPMMHAVAATIRDEILRRLDDGRSRSA
jgi:DNA (cytosine-5)-methyltransferase 1